MRGHEVYLKVIGMLVIMALLLTGLVVALPGIDVADEH
jgi:hypothetical protein